MTTYAKDVLVETDWLADHAKDPNVRAFEVDVDTTAYDQGHIAGAIGLNWRTDLQQHPVRDLIEKRQLEELLAKNGVTPATTIEVPCSTCASGQTAQTLVNSSVVSLLPATKTAGFPAA